MTVASTPADLDWLASEMETGGTVVVVTPRITSACGPSCGDSNGAWSRRLGGYYECATYGAGWG